MSRSFCLIAAITTILLSGSALADWDAIQKRGHFVWGADKEGGGPFIYSPNDDPNKIVGFEVDLANAIAAKLGVEARSSQRDWDVLLQNLDRGDVDLVINGYEYTPQRAAAQRASIPYYIYELGLLARADDLSIVDWNSLSQPPAGGKRRRLGVLEGSAADHFVTERYAAACDILRYSGSVEAMNLVQSRGLDATVQDLPVCLFYVRHGKDYAGLRIVGKPRAPGQYVIYARNDDETLANNVNSAIRTLYDSGELRAIYERYGIWTETQQQLPEYWQRVGNADAPQVSTWKVLELNWPLFWRAARTTVKLAVLSMPLAILIGLALALIRGSTPGSMLEGVLPFGRIVGAVLRGAATIYVEVVRGTPLAFQLWVVYFVLPKFFGVWIDEFWAGVIGLAVNYSAYEAEIFRLGLQAIPRGQMEAAQALGMSPALAVRRIIMPQALRITIPATANDFIALFKDTAVCSVIAVEELSKVYSMQAKSTGLLLEMAVMASLLYLAMSIPLSMVAAWLERRLSPDRRH